MPTNNMVSLLAKHGGPKAAKLTKQAVQNKAVKTAIDELRDAAVTALAPLVIEGGKAAIEGGKAALRRPIAYHKNRRLAVQVAQQIGGTHDRVVIAGDWYWIVRQEDETPFEAYPPLPESLGPLAERRELQNFKPVG